jgi:hypothetical protein
MNMTIKAQAFLQGYMREKAASYPLDPNPRVTPIVAAPGIPQTEGDPGVKPLFQDGKARFKRTQLQMPTTALEFPTPDIMKKLENERLPDYVKHRAKGSETLTPASVNDQLLQNLPIPAAEFVAEQKRNFKRDRLPWNKSKVRPSSDLIDFDKRNQPVSLDTWPGWLGQGASTYPRTRRIEGLDPEMLRKHPEGKEWEGQDDSRQDRDYHGYPETPDGRSRGYPKDSMLSLMHELTHNYTGGREPGDYVRGDVTFPVGTSYITNRGTEYTQGVTSGLNAMRDITGEKLNDPPQVHQLFDEIVADPSILDSITSESARVFRTYLTLRETNPKLAEKLRESMARDSQYLVESERAGDPMVQKA